VDKFAGLANSAGLFYPTGFVVALIPNRGDADATAEDLRQNAFRDVREFTPQEIIDHLDEIKQNRSFWDRLTNAMSESEMPAQTALQQVKAGCYAVMAQVDDDVELSKARALMHAHNARMTGHWTKWNVRLYNAA
jgi:hypothetical protein